MLCRHLDAIETEVTARNRPPRSSRARTAGRAAPLIKPDPLAGVAELALSVDAEPGHESWSMKQPRMMPGVSVHGVRLSVLGFRRFLPRWRSFVREPDVRRSHWQAMPTTENRTPITVNGYFPVNLPICGDCAISRTVTNLLRP